MYGFFNLGFGGAIRVCLPELGMDFLEGKSGHEWQLEPLEVRWLGRPTSIQNDRPGGSA